MHRFCRSKLAFHLVYFAFDDRHLDCQKFFVVSQK